VLEVGRNPVISRLGGENVYRPFDDEPQRVWLTQPDRPVAGTGEPLPVEHGHLKKPHRRRRERLMVSS
jgi:hypothetical protein